NSSKAKLKNECETFLVYVQGFSKNGADCDAARRRIFDRFGRFGDWLGYLFGEELVNDGENFPRTGRRFNHRHFIGVHEEVEVSEKVH
ncbi:hypothetical protein U1Q18_044458, partial [Sarracenia purpurea var. burkii]